MASQKYQTDITTSNVSANWPLQADFKSSRYYYWQCADILGFSSDFSLLFQIYKSFDNSNAFNNFIQYERILHQDCPTSKGPYPVPFIGFDNASRTIHPGFIACDKSAAGMGLGWNGERLLGLQSELEVCLVKIDQFRVIPPHFPPFSNHGRCQNWLLQGLWHTRSQQDDIFTNATMAPHSRKLSSARFCPMSRGMTVSSPLAKWRHSRDAI